MNKEIMKQAGFSEEVELMEQWKCPFCKSDTKNAVFRDARSKKEFEISGLCQKCQDEIFGG